MWMIRLVAGGLALCAASPALADQVWAGFYDHDVTIAQTPFEGGYDIKAGWIGEPIAALRAVGGPAPHVLVSKPAW